MTDPLRARLAALPRYLLWRLADRFQWARDQANPDEPYVRWSDVEAALRAGPETTFTNDDWVQAIADEEAALRAVPEGEPPFDAALVLRTCEVVGGVLAFAMGRTWGEGHKYWAARFDEANEAISQLRQAALRAVPAATPADDQGRRLLARIQAIRDEAIKEPPARDFDLKWQLGRFIADLEAALCAVPVGEDDGAKLLKRYLDNHCANADCEGMSVLCDCTLCQDTRVYLGMPTRDAARAAAPRCAEHGIELICPICFGVTLEAAAAPEGK